MLTDPPRILIPGVNMQVRIEVDEKTVRQLVADHLARQLGSLTPDISQVRIEVKSTQNYRSEWEPAAFRAVYEKKG